MFGVFFTIMRVESTILNIDGCNNFKDKFVKSSLMLREQNYASLPYNPVYFHPAFGMRNPKAAMHRTTHLSAKYAEKGFRYLLPHEVWSDGKIMQTVRDFGKTLDELANNNLLNKETFQEAVNRILPEHAKGKIVIKDFSDLQQDLRSGQYPEKLISRYLGHNAITESRPQGSTLYLRFRKFNDKNEKIDFEVDAQHELKHALSARLQNTLMTDVYRNNFGKCDKQNDVFLKIKSAFESNYYRLFTIEQVERTQENMLKFLGFESIEQMHKHFNLAINGILDEARSSGELNIDSISAEKQLFSFLKHSMKDEKEAYKTGIKWREKFDDPSSPTDAELIPMVYAEMEKFFAEKEKALVSAGPN